MSSSGKIYTNRLSHSRFYLAWQQTKDGGKTINWQIGIETKDETGYYDNWYLNAITIAEAKINDKLILSNGVYSNIEGGASRELANGSIEVDKSNFKISIKGSLYNTGIASKEEEVYVYIEPSRPSVDISVTSKTATTMTIKANVNNNISASKYTFACGNLTQEVSTNTYKFTGLIPDTKYTIKARAYGNEGWGNYSSSFSTTSKQATITSAELNTNGGQIIISNPSGEDCNIAILIENKEIARKNNIMIETYDLIFSDEEQKKIYKAMGINNSIDCILRLENANRSKDYEKNITVSSDAFSCSIVVNGVRKKGRLWIGTPDGNKRGIFIVGTKNGNRRGK